MDSNRKHDAVVAVDLPRVPPIEALLGSDPGTCGAAPPSPAKVTCGPLEVDRVERRAVLAGTDVPLTEREFELLLFLVDRVNRAVPRSDLLGRIWTLEVDYGSNILDVYIARLRQRFGPHAGMIQTVRGFGYRLRPPLDAASPLGTPLQTL
jgi:DNA-binding response OmpR family regulator